MKKKLFKSAHEDKYSEDSHQHGSTRSVKKQIFTAIGLLTCLIIATIFVILYARGYRLFVDKGAPGVSKTGILHITSIPTSAQVFIDDHPNPTTATNGTLNLTPKKYKVKIAKDGYNDWQKDIQIQAEEVAGVEALLFPKSPTLQSISTFGVEEAIIDPSGSKLAFKIASQSSQKRNGIYIFDMTARNLPILQGQSSASQIADDTADKFSDASLTWSPDGKQLLASISATIEDPLPQDLALETPTTPVSPTYYLLKTDELNEAPLDISTTLIETLDLWNTQRLDKQKARIRSLKPKVAQFSNQYFRILSWSPDDSKILYQASESAQMPVFLTPRRIGNNPLYERRDLEKNAIYVYNTREDVNTRIIDSIDTICNEDESSCNNESSDIQKNPFRWFSDSAHLIYVHDKKIQIVEDDGANMTTIYAGPFLGQYVFPWPDGSKIVILTNLGNPSVSPTLYTIGLK